MATSASACKAGVQVRAYDEDYVADAMENLGEFFEYAVYDCGAEGAEVAELFCMSRTGGEFAHGNPHYVAGLSGSELLWELDLEFGGDGTGPWPQPRFERSPEFWVGWTAAYVQWRLNIGFDLLFSVIPFNEFVELYHPWHEASEERFCALVAERIRAAGRPTNLARLRRSIGITQQELAQRSGVGLRSIQMYEQRQKDINKAQLGTASRLARALWCPIESLLEPELPEL